MTRDRVYGSDTPFLAWCRAKGKTGELPSFSSDCGVVVTDVDCTIHRYMSAVDRQGTRELQVLMEIETKTRGAEPTASQIDTYRKKHATTLPHLKWNGQTIVNRGVSVLIFSHTGPSDSPTIQWWRFKRGNTTEIVKNEISVEQLLQLLRCDINPDTLQPNPYRRHHKTSSITTTEVSALGFQVQRHIITRS